MDYSGFSNFPFPAALDAADEALKGYFDSLTDEQQLAMLGGCESFQMFRERLAQAIQQN